VLLNLTSFGLVVLGLLLLLGVVTVLHRPPTRPCHSLRPPGQARQAQVPALRLRVRADSLRAVGGRRDHLALIGLRPAGRKTGDSTSRDPSLTRSILRPLAKGDLMEFEQRYRVMETRDESYVGEFFAAVTSTGIYCRPGCPARTPKRENMRFYRTAEAARSDGFRACLRCHP
jgi:hypothetical protein